MNPKNRKIVIDAKIRGQLNLTLPLILGQNSRTQKRFETLIMKVNKWIYGGQTFKKENTEICKKIGNLQPEQDMLISSAKFIHKLLTQKESMSLHEHIIIPKRAKSIIYHRNPKKKLYRTALENLIHLYNQIPHDNKPLKMKTFTKKLKKEGIDYRPPD